MMKEDSNKATRSDPNRWILLASVSLIVILGFVAYGNSISGEFIWDDHDWVKDNLYIRSWSNLPRVFSENILPGVGRKRSSYRPIQTITYMVDYSLWRLNVNGYHITNILLHVSVALTIYWLVNLLFEDKLLSLLTSLFFLLHPVHTEAISYISGRADPLAALFMLLSIIFYIKNLYSKSGGLYVLSLSAYILAILSRENSLILPAIMLLYHYAFKKRIEIRKFLPVAGIALIYIILRATVLRSSVFYAVHGTSLYQRIPGFFAAMAGYMKIMLLPVQLHMEYRNKLFYFNNPLVITGMITALFLLACALMKRKSNALIFFAISWFFITLLPQSNIYPINAYMAEHWLYLPSIGLFLILGQALVSLYRRGGFRILAAAIVISLLSFYSYLTIEHSGYWREPIVFFERTSRYAPGSHRIYNNLGIAYSSVGRNEEAISSYKKALEINPRYAEAHNNLALVYQDTGRREEAIISLQKTIEINPRYVKAYYNLGIAYADTGRAGEAIAFFKKAMELYPGYAEAYNNLGLVYTDIGKREEAIASLRKAVEINPRYAKAYNHLGIAYADIGRKEEAMASFKKAIEINPRLVKPYYNLGIAYADIGRKEEAMASFEKAIEINPRYAKAYNNLGLVYMDTGRKGEAIDLLKKAIEINPGNEKAYNNLGFVYMGMGKTEEAIALFNKAIGINPGHAEVYNNLGSAYTDLGRREEAISLFKRAIEIEQGSGEAHGNLAMAYYESKQYDLAAEHCERAIELGYKVNPRLSKFLESYRK